MLRGKKQKRENFSQEEHKCAECKVRGANTSQGDHNMVVNGDSNDKPW
jgi:hypothetical protein